jgi:hypothetical protein
MGGNRRHRNAILRPQVNKVLDTIQCGGKVEVAPIAMSFTDRCRQIEPKTIANMLKEREDFIPKGNGVWERVTV